MKKFRCVLASVLAASLVHGPLAQAAFLTGSAPQPVDQQMSASPLAGSPSASNPFKTRTAPVALPGKGRKALPATAVLPGQPAAAAAAPVDPAGPPPADAVLQEMGAQIAADPKNIELDRYYDGEELRRDETPAVPAQAGADGPSGLTDKAAPQKKQSQAVPAPQAPSQHAAVVPVVVIVAIVAAVVAAGTGIYLWLRGKSKNDAWEKSKSNQDIIALEKARRDNDPASLATIKTEARGRQQRMDERVANAESAGSKKVDLSDGKSISVKEARTYAAFDGLVASRAEMNENAVSQDPEKRVGADLPAVWKSRVSGLEAQAKQSEFEGPLALSLKSMRSEVAKEDAAASRYQKDIAGFDATVPGLFGGRLKEMTKRAQKDLSQFQTEEIDAEKIVLEKTNSAMRGRVSDRLTAKDSEYQGHLARLQTLDQAAEGTLKSAVDMARQVDKDMQDMASHERSRALNLMLAAQNENVLVDDYDSQGRKTGSHYEDQSATYKALAASAGAEARASAASAQAGVKALNTIIPLLHKDPVLKAEGLTFALPSNSGRGPNSSGSVFFDFWLPASWSFFGTMFSESQAGQARAGFAPVKGSLESVMSEVNGRRGAERTWTDKKIDHVLDAQMKQALPKN